MNGHPEELPCGFQVIFGFPDPGMTCVLAKMSPWYCRNVKQIRLIRRVTHSPSPLVKAIQLWEAMLLEIILILSHAVYEAS